MVMKASTILEIGLENEASEYAEYKLIESCDKEEKFETHRVGRQTNMIGFEESLLWLAATSIFASGKMVCLGAKSEAQSKVAARKCALTIQKLGFSAKFKDFKIRNMVATCDVKFPIRLDGLACAETKHISYQAELFPGLIYRMKEPKVTLLVFASGKVVITGAKCRQDIDEAFKLIYPVLEEFKKVDLKRSDLLKI